MIISSEGGAMRAIDPLGAVLPEVAKT